MDNQKYGGPSYSLVTCKNCNKKWSRHRLGSFDWEYKDCPSCYTTKLGQVLTKGLKEAAVSEGLDLPTKDIRDEMDEHMVKTSSAKRL